jgi:hypothetical protein
MPLAAHLVELRERRLEMRWVAAPARLSVELSEAARAARSLLMVASGPEQSWVVLLAAELVPR